jgi:cell division protein FtsI/penicillin-binding protein 2
MVVFIENGGGAGSVAAPFAAEIYKKLFKNERHD